MKKALLIIGSILCATPISSYANLYCKGKDINGFTKFDVKRFCGSPLMKETYIKSGELSGGSSVSDISWVVIEQWFYEQGPKKISYTVEFEEGAVARVIQGESAK